MASQQLLYPCGHSWERPDTDSGPANVRAICPVCTPSIRAASHPTVSGPDRERSQLKPGDMLAGFEIIRPLNRGGMGVVYQARQSGLNRLVALKVIAPEQLGGADQAEFLERFRREARAAALLNHPNIVTVFATDLSGAQPYFAMEYVEGIDLYRLVQQTGPIEFMQSCDYIRQAALGLQHALECGMVHRDIKPHNLMVTPSPLGATSESGSRRKPLVKILDMGLARLDAPEEGLAEGLTRTEAFLGTPDYAAPEQAEDSRRVDIRADLYSLGATWFFLLTGEVPFPGVTLMQKLRRQLTRETPLVTDHRPDVPAVLVALIRKLMDRDPAQRFQTPAELADAIADFERDPTRTPDWMGESTDVPAVVPAHAGAVTAIAINGDGTLVLTGGDDQTLRVWAAPGLSAIRAMAGDVGLVSAAALTASGKWAASCALRLMPQDMVVQLWDLASGSERRRLRGPHDSLASVALSADGRKVAAGARDGIVHVWALEPRGTPPLMLRGHVGAVNGVAFTPDGLAVLSGGDDGTLRHWDAASGAGEVLLHGDAGAIRAIACAKATGQIALAGERLVLCQTELGVMTLAGHDGPVLTVAFSADGTLVASGGSDHCVRVWRTSDGVELAKLEGQGGPVRAVAFCPQRRHLYSGAADGKLRRWPLRTIVSQKLTGSGWTAKR